MKTNQLQTAISLIQTSDVNNLTDDRSITAAVSCFSIRFLWTHTGHKHSKQKDQTVWWQQGGDQRWGGTVVSWSSRQIRLVSAPVHNWSDWSLLLGGRVERTCWYISELQRNQQERNQIWLQVWKEWSVVESGVLREWIPCLAQQRRNIHILLIRLLLLHL